MFQPSLKRQCSVARAGPGLEESVGKIKNRENWGYKNHSTRLKNSLEGECGPKVFRKRRRTLFSDRLFQGASKLMARFPVVCGPPATISQPFGLPLEAIYLVRVCHSL